MTNEAIERAFHESPARTAAAPPAVPVVPFRDDTPSPSEVGESSRSAMARSAAARAPTRNGAAQPVVPRTAGRSPVVSPAEASESARNPAAPPVVSRTAGRRSVVSPVETGESTRHPAAPSAVTSALARNATAPPVVFRTAAPSAPARNPAPPAPSAPVRSPAPPAPSAPARSPAPPLPAPNRSSRGRTRIDPSLQRMIVSNRRRHELLQLPSDGVVVFVPQVAFSSCFGSGVNIVIRRPPEAPEELTYWAETILQ